MQQYLYVQDHTTVPPCYLGIKLGSFWELEMGYFFSSPKPHPILFPSYFRVITLLDAENPSQY